MAIAFINCWLLGVNDFFKWTKFRTFFLFFLFASLNNTVFNKEKLFVASVSISVFLLLWFAESLSVSWNFKRKERNEFLSFIFLFAYLLFIPTDKCNIYCYFFPSVLRWCSFHLKILFYLTKKCFLFRFHFCSFLALFWSITSDFITLYLYFSSQPLRCTANSSTTDHLSWLLFCHCSWSLVCVLRM